MIADNSRLDETGFKNYIMADGGWRSNKVLKSVYKHAMRQIFEQHSRRKILRTI